MSDEKKPKKEPKEDQPQEPRVNENKDASLLDRVGTSASGLFQTFSSRPAPSTISNDLASLHASTSKGESSSNLGYGGTIDSQQASTITQAQDSGSSFSGNSETFRSRPLHDPMRTQEDFDHWSRIPMDLPENDTFGNNKSDHLIGNLRTRPRKTQADTLSKITRGRQYGDIVESDGAAVASLLSRPNFDMDVVPSDTWDSTSQSQEPDIENNLITDRGNLENLLNRSSALSKQNDNSDQLKSNNPGEKATSIAQAELLKRKPPPQAGSLLPNEAQINKDRQWNQYGLMPNFWSTSDGNIKTYINDKQRDEIKRTISIAEEQTKPWLAILDKYHDEVWGDMLPLVHEAREEVKKARESQVQPPNNPLVGPAVRRLQMVLKHMSNTQV